MLESRLLLAGLLLHAAGCLKDRAAIEKGLLAQPAVQEADATAKSYRVACPDVIELEIPQRSEFTGQYEIAPDGRINLGDYGNPRIEGRLLAEVAEVIGKETGVNRQACGCAFVEFRSQYLLIFGEVAGRQRSVSYRGQETVVDLLQRVGGISPGAAPDDVYVVRPHLGDNRRPEIFRVDLNAIILKQDQRTNLRILPFDQIYVGESRQAKFEDAIPPWLRWMAQAVSGEKSEAGGQTSEVRSQRSEVGSQKTPDR